MNRYFMGARPSTERHLFSVPIPISSSEKMAEATALTDTSKPGYFSVKFSPEAGYYVLVYKGPSTPWTKVVNADSSCESFNYDISLGKLIEGSIRID